MNLDLNKNGFLVIRSLYDVRLHTPNIPDLYEYMLELEHSTGEDHQVANAKAFYNNLELCKLQMKIMPRIEKIIEERLYPTYSYARIYNQGSELKKHKDREACEISVSMNIGQRGDNAWPIFIEDFQGKTHEVILDKGDAVLYKGCEVYHWRNKAGARVRKYAQAFLHYVIQDGMYEDHIFDNPFAPAKTEREIKKELLEKIFNKKK